MHRLGSLKHSDYVSDMGRECDSYNYKEKFILKGRLTQRKSHVKYLMVNSSLHVIPLQYFSKCSYSNI